MPTYRVKAGQTGFYGGQLHTSEKRNTIVRDEPFPKVKGKEQVPSWLEPVKDQTPAQKKTAAKKATAKKDADEQAAAEQAAEVGAVTFTGKQPSVVETL